MRSTLSILLAFLLLLGAGCALGGQEEPEPVSDPDPAPDPVELFPVTRTDYAGREITVESEPQKIISLAPSNTEILFALGLGDRVVGADTYSDYPEEASGVPRVGDVYGLNMEDILELAPDLILMIGGTEEARQQLEDNGLLVAVIQPATFEEILESFILIGELTGAVQEAEQLRTSIEEEAWALMEATGQLEPPLVFIETWNDPLMTVGPGGFLHELVEIAGGRNLASDAGMEWFVIEEEVVLERDPEVIVTFFQESYISLTEGKRPGWDSVTAVREGQIHTIDSDLLVRPGPRIIMGLKDLVRALHPGVLSD